MSLDFNLIDGNGNVILDVNISHNYTSEAKECGLYECLWCPIENNWRYAFHIVDRLYNGISNLKMRPCHEHNGKLLAFTEKVFSYALANPHLRIEVSK